jgi:hypothetical protein
MCAVQRRRSSVGAIPTRQLSFQPVAIGTAGEVTNPSELSMERAASGGSASGQAVTRVNAEQAPKLVMWEPTRHCHGEGRRHGLSRCSNDIGVHGPTGVMATACLPEEIDRNTGNPRWWGGPPQPDAREGQAGPSRAADRLVVPSKPGNSGGGKGPDFGSVPEVVQSRESGHVAYNLHPTAWSSRKGLASRRRRGACCTEPWAVLANPVGEPDAGNPPVRFDEREVETEQGPASEAPADERAGNG